MDVRRSRALRGWEAAATGGEGRAAGGGDAGDARRGPGRLRCSAALPPERAP